MLRKLILLSAMLLLGYPVWGGDTRVVDVTIAARKAAVDGNTIRVNEAEKIELRWHADEAVELHLHGYERAVQVPAGGHASMTFEAYATGRFPISHHGFGENMGREHSQRPILYLEVLPK